ncbi:MAG: DUF1905 domain-containing protein, partial [Cytophagales bacterium]|nr:DUF1905 domain-containing protein [Cytophagales bacterium]
MRPKPSFVHFYFLTFAWHQDQTIWIRIAPLIKGTFTLEKIPGKGGWTYVALPGLLPDRGQPFGWRRVRGRVDSHQLEAYKLMPMGDGKLFLPVKASVRKKLGKQEGDQVDVELYPDELPLSLPEELTLCLRQETGALDAFQALAE